MIKKGRNHGARHGKTKEQTEYHIAWNAWKRCCKKVDSQGEHVTGIHDRFLRDPVYRGSQLAIGRSEQKCNEWDELAKEDHTYKLTPEERRRCKGQWYLTQNKEGKNGPMKLRSDFRAAVMMKNRLHHESREPIEEPIHPGQQRRNNRDKNFSPKITSTALELTNIQDGNIGLHLQIPRGGTHPNGVRSELTVFFYSWFHLQSIAIHCNRRGGVNRTPSHCDFLMHLHTCVHTTFWLKVSHDVSA